MTTAKWILLMCSVLVWSLAVMASASAQSDVELRVPGFTAYSEPEPEAMQFSEAQGVTGWADPKQSVVWYGDIRTPGRLDLSVEMRLPKTKGVSLALHVGNRTLTAAVVGANDAVVTVPFGSVDFAAPGYCRIALQGLKKVGDTFGEVKALILSGPAVENTHFNVKERRNASSVHLGYPIPEGAKVVSFYNEVTVRTDPIWSYYMACGFRRGYFGIQVNSPTERRIIFSIWDSGNEGVDRSKVAAEDRVQLLAKGKDVTASDFGNEGTGGHSHMVYPWKTGQTYRFLVTVKPDGTHTVYSGYFYFPERKAWGLIASFRAPKDGDTLRGLYSFNEDFAGANGQKRRLAEFGPQWIQTEDGKWTELLKARFTHDATGNFDRTDYAAGVKGERFTLSNGGFVGIPIHLGDIFTRTAAEKPPTILLSPNLPSP